jgi:hypothetical protein
MRCHSLGSTVALWATMTVAAATLCHAAPIQIDLSTEFPSNDLTTVTIAVSNVGEAPAYRLAVDTLFAGQTTETDSLETLGPGQRHAWVVRIPPVPGAGTYPLMVGLRYADAGDFPSSALLVHLIPSPNAPANKVHARLEILPTAGVGSGMLYLENPLPVAVTGRVALLLPREFTAEPATQIVQLPAQSRLEVPLALQNRNALLGSRAPATALFEYDLEGTHFSVAANTVIEVNFGPRDRYTGWAIAVGLLTVLAAMTGGALWFNRRPAKAA